MALGFRKAVLIGTFLECIAYGIYFAVFLRALQILHRKLVPGIAFVYLLGTTIVLWLLTTVRLMLNVPTTVGVITTNKDIVPNASGISIALWVAHTIVADIFIVYRVYAIWSRSVLISVVPFLLAIADMVGGVLLIAQTPKLVYGVPTHGSIIFYALAFDSLTLALNILCTVLIASKLYISERQTRLSSSLNLRSIATIVVESAALYSVCLILLVVSILGHGDIYDLQWLFLKPLSSIVGLNFSLIIIRVGSGACIRKSICDDTTRGTMQFARPGQTRCSDEPGLDVAAKITTVHSKVDPSDAEAQSRRESETQNDRERSSKC
ncbi:hypothetical protein PM082_020347 [Marasmius tenuissimus]|nr:hypothetical protein PM082_020347 [Marasmius tenuissimus]